ncbi:MAG: nucleotidyl transferase AbiEii/AbiGii toxin family protein [Acidobacteria bacterium]|nr:nucleotidyl transferase AbiEii/AbiGii toxin family protein [Acidobacteriota bacterium]
MAPFYLAGGTGLALHFGHRRSFDLDFFIHSLDEERLLQSLMLYPLAPSGRWWRDSESGPNSIGPSTTATASRARISTRIIDEREEE